MNMYTVSYEWMSEDVHVCGLSVISIGWSTGYENHSVHYVFFCNYYYIISCKINLYNTKTMCKHSYKKKPNKICTLEYGSVIWLVNVTCMKPAIHLSATVWCCFSVHSLAALIGTRIPKAPGCNYPCHAINVGMGKKCELRPL